jgi:NAD(P)-dependent dehydrogenase (short-subunit alcohol dehydrogenase family)
LRHLVESIEEAGENAKAFFCDATVDAQVTDLFDRVEESLGPVTVAVFNAAGGIRRSITELEARDIEDVWRQGCLGGFLVARQAARRMANGGTILFTGGQSSTQGFPDKATYAVAKFGLRGLADSMARELSPRGIHVAHIILDGPIKPGANSPLDPNSIADVYFQIHAQDPDNWTHSVKLSPMTDAP